MCTVLSVSLRDQAIRLALEDHAGMTRCKQKIQAKLWWPQVDKQIEEHIRCCHPCQVISKPPHPEPVNPTDLPKAPWTKLAIDICGTFPTGDYVAALTVLKTVITTTILNWLNTVFPQHGYPEELSYFTSAEYRDTLRSWRVETKTVTEYWQQANGQVERFIGVIKKHILTARAAGQDRRKPLPTLLLQYKTTPHRMNGQTPAKLHMQRELWTKISSIKQNNPKSNHDISIPKIWKGKSQGLHR